MKFAIVLALVAVLVLSGCGENNTSGGRAFVGGIEGLTTQFIEGSPPAEIYDNQQSGFSIIVQMENTGEDDIEKGEGYVQIKGLDPKSYGVTSLKKSFDTEIRGAKKNADGSVLNGGIGIVEFGDLKYMYEIQGNLQQTVWADICYKYTTKTTAQLCVKKDPQLLLDDEKICDVEGDKEYQNSGGPIQVTSLKESFGGQGKLLVYITLTHSGTGDNFFDPRENLNGNACNDVSTNTKKGMIHVLVKPINVGGKSITPKCSGLSDTSGDNEGYVRLNEDGSGKAQYLLYCSIDASSTDSEFEVPIDIETTYLYLEHLEKEITIRHIAK
ncbi:MAG: hypothetical protein ACP5NV_04970 [Candidatus Woesearchaeota archaeon]